MAGYGEWLTSALATTQQQHIKKIKTNARTHAHPYKGCLMGLYTSLLRLCVYLSEIGRIRPDDKIFVLVGEQRNSQIIR